MIKTTELERTNQIILQQSDMFLLKVEWGHQSDGEHTETHRELQEHMQSVMSADSVRTVEKFEVIQCSAVFILTQMNLLHSARAFIAQNPLL